MRNLRPITILVTILMLFATASAQQPSTTPLLTAPQRAMKIFQLDSKLMSRPMPYGVIFPDGYDVDKNYRYPVIYVLPGSGASYKVTTLSAGLDPAKYKDIQRVILVFVDSGGTGWYTDSATKPNDKYETYVVNELIPEIDKNLRTVAERRGRAVAGISMGGFGSLKFGIKYPKLFSLTDSWSGAVNITTFPDMKEYSWLDPKALADVKEKVLIPIFGDGKDRTVINANDLTRLFTEYPAEKLKDLPFFYLDCGTEDNLGFFKPNRDLSELMINRKIPHEYREFPGGHGVTVPDRLLDLYRLSENMFARQTEEQFVRVLEQHGFEQAVKLYKENRPIDPQQPIFSESFLNSLGYTLIEEKRLPLALEVFKLNVEANPSSWNPYDSLGEAYVLSGNKELAIKSYEKSIVLNPNNKSGIEALKRLKSNP